MASSLTPTITSIYNLNFANDITWLSTNPCRHDLAMEFLYRANRIQFSFI